MIIKDDLKNMFLSNRNSYYRMKSHRTQNKRSSYSGQDGSSIEFKINQNNFIPQSVKNNQEVGQNRVFSKWKFEYTRRKKLNKVFNLQDKVGVREAFKSIKLYSEQRLLEKQCMISNL